MPESPGGEVASVADKSARDPALDAVRGVALCGLLFLNVFYFALFPYGYVAPSPNQLDGLLSDISHVFFDGRFRTLFCLLFGAGLWIRAAKHHRSVTSIQSKMVVLCILGLLHGLGLFAGDILLTYGLAALLVAGLVERELDDIKRYAGVFFTLAFTLNTLFMLGDSGIPDFASQKVQSEISMLGQGFWAQRISNAGYFIKVLPGIFLVTLWYTVSLALAGVYLFRKGWFSTLLPPGTLLVIFAAALGVGLLSLYASKSNGALYALAQSLNWIAAFLMALAYSQVLLRIFLWRMWHGFIVAGRLSLSLYILQSVAMVIIFGLYGEYIARTFTRVDYWLLALFVMTLLLVLARCYDRYFSTGPFEFIWRKFTA